MDNLSFLLLIGLGLLFLSNRSLKQRIERLEQQALEGRAPTADAWPESHWTPAAASPAPPSTIAEMASPQAEPPETVPLPPAEPESERETISQLFERLVAGRLLIWTGGAALIVSAIFLIRFSIEIGLVTPAMRMAAAGLFGLLLIGLGEYARRGRLLADDPRIAQVLVGAGIAILYASVYGAQALYGLIGPGFATILMLAVTLGALGLSFRHGAPTAIMGLVGGFLTPLLVGDRAADTLTLLFYLAMLDLALFVIAWRRGWTWLAAAAVVLSFVWSFYLLSRPPAEAMMAGLFILTLSIAATLARPGPGRELALVQPLAVGIVQLALLSARTDLGASAWLLFGLLAAASMGIALFRPRFAPAPLLAAVLALALLGVRAWLPADPVLPFAALGSLALFGGGGLALAWWRPRISWALVASLGLAGPPLILRAARPLLLVSPAWGLLFLLAAAGAGLLVWRLRARAAAERIDLALTAAGLALVLLGGAAAMELLGDRGAISAWLLLAILLALAADRWNDRGLALLAVAVGVAAAARALWLAPGLATAGITGLIGDPVLAGDLPSAADALWLLALPALLFVGLWRSLPDLAQQGRSAALGAASLFGLAAFYVWFKQAFGLGEGPDFVARGLLERTIVTQALFLLGWWLAARRAGSDDEAGGAPPLARLGTILTAAAALRLFWFDLLIHNPAWSDQQVGSLPILNLVLADYLLGALWLYLARRRAARPALSGLWLTAFLVSLIAGTLLLVRQLFHGTLMTGPLTGTAETYAYSLALLVLSIALLLAGMRLPDKAVRLAGLLLLTATISKVFLVDAAALEGLLRILSFLGLGIALIGIGRLYGPVLRAERRPPRAETAPEALGP